MYKKREIIEELAKFLIFRNKDLEILTLTFNTTKIAYVTYYEYCVYVKHN